MMECGEQCVVITGGKEKLLSHVKLLDFQVQASI